MDIDSILKCTDVLPGVCIYHEADVSSEAEYTEFQRLISDEKAEVSWYPRIVVAFWPNATFTFWFIQSDVKLTDFDIFDKLDEHANPVDAVVYVVSFQDENASVETPSIDVNMSAHPSPAGRRLSIAFGEETSVARYRFRKNVVRNYLRSRYCNRNSGYEIESLEVPQAMGIYSDKVMPSPPPPEFTFDDIARMEPFSGVYLAYCGMDCVYVGEAKDVTKRCRPSKERMGREFLGVTAIGVLKTLPEERKRLEKYFIGLLNPSRNREIWTEGPAKEQRVCLLEKIPFGEDDGFTCRHEFEQSVSEFGSQLDEGGGKYGR